jgi:chromosome segregation ATPase
MDNALVYTAFGLAALTSVVSLALFISRTKLQENIRSLQDKLTLEQARRSEAVTTERLPKKKPDQPKPAAEKSKHEAELIELRKNNARMRDEIKHLKEDVRHNESGARELANRVESETFKLRAENQALIERLRDLDTNSPEKKRAHALEQENTALKESVRTIQSDLSAATAKLKSERTFAERQKVQLKTLESRLREISAKLPEQPQTDTPKIDPKTLERWKDRALTARHMYQMMRQMRELSDLKLSTYQDAVLEVSQSLIELKGGESPTVGPREIKADRYLAEAWSLVQTQTATSPIS